MQDVQSNLAMLIIKNPYTFDFIVLKGQVKEKQTEDDMIEKMCLFSWIFISDR